MKRRTIRAAQRAIKKASMARGRVSRPKTKEDIEFELERARILAEYLGKEKDSGIE